MHFDRKNPPESLTKAALGRYGEEVVERALNRSGWKTVGRNVRERAGEIDLIVSRRGVLRFVEVKTGLVGSLGTEEYAPEERVGPRKLLHMERAALSYLARLEGEPEFHIDVASVRVEAKTGRIRLEFIADAL